MVQGRTHRLAAGSQLLTLPRTPWHRAIGSKEAPERTGGGAIIQQRQPAIWIVGGRLHEVPMEIAPRFPVLLALVASAPRDRKEKIRVSLSHLETGRTLRIWHSWLRGHMEGVTFSWVGDGRGRLCARGLGSGVGLRGERPRSRGHFCLSSFRAWRFCWGVWGVGRKFCRRELSLSCVVCGEWFCSWSQGWKI